LYRLLVVLLVLWGLIIVLETTSLLQASRRKVAGTLRLQRVIRSWRQRNESEASEADEWQGAPAPLADAGDPREVADEDLLHLSLLHEHCVKNVNASLPWEFGSPGHQLPNASASNPEVVMQQGDEDLLQKLRQCPDVDIFLPAGLHGNGYCEDAVAYAKCKLW